jgi:5-methylcytosine-specific restriction endonuclease McrA
MAIKHQTCYYTAEGRKELHTNLSLNINLLIQLMKKTQKNSNEFADNRLSLFSAQDGKCAVTQEKFVSTEEIHCHHIIPKSKGGTDEYKNLILVSNSVHKLIHATKAQTILKYRNLLGLNRKQLTKINQLRKSAGLIPIKI